MKVSDADDCKNDYICHKDVKFDNDVKVRIGYKILNENICQNSN